MSLMRSLTTRRKPEIEALKPVQLGRAASQRGGRPVMRTQISPPLALVSTTNILSFEAPDIAGTKPVQHISPASATSSSSEESDSSASIHSRDTDPTDLSSADASPISPKDSTRFFENPRPTVTRSRSSSLVRSPPVPALSLSVAPTTLETHNEESPATALHPNGLATAKAQSPYAAGLTPATAVSPSIAAMVFSPSVIGLSPNGLTPVSAIRTPISAVRSTGTAESSSPESPILPRRAPSHSKRAHEALSRKRSVQRARSPSAQGRMLTRASADILNAHSPAYTDSPDSIFSPALEQVREEGAKAKYADAAMDAHILKTRGLAHFAASDYMDEINPLVTFYLDDNAPTCTDFSGWF